MFVVRLYRSLNCLSGIYSCYSLDVRLSSGSREVQKWRSTWQCRIASVSRFLNVLIKPFYHITSTVVNFRKCTVN